MVQIRKGRSLPLTAARRLMDDLLHFARKVPSIPVQKRMDLTPLAAARRSASPRPSWVALFARAYALVAAEMPRLRRSYLGFPYPRLYEHADSSASIAIERIDQGEEIVLFGRLRAPERQTINEIDGHLRRWKTAPLTEVGSFRRALRISRLWRWLRRAAWWYGLNVFGETRERYFGTFGISVYSNLGVDSLHPLSPLTTLLNYGPISPDSQVDVRIVYDHRVLDGAAVARAMVRLEEVLRGTLVEELTSRVAGAA
jgi:hypothetical protein